LPDAETNDLPATAAAAVANPRVPASLPSPWLYIAVIGPLYFLAGGLVQAIQLPLGLLWNQAFLFVWPSLLWLTRWGFHPAAFTRATRRPDRLPLVLGISVSALVCASAMMGIFESLAPPEWVKFFDETQVLSSVSGPWLGVLFTGVIVGAPIAEELVFRGCLLPMLAGRMRLGWALVVQAALFSLIHGDPIGFLPRFVLGLAFGMLWIYSGSLWAGIFAHALNNGISALIFLYVSPDTDPGNELGIALTGAIPAVVLIFLLWFLRRVSRPAPLPSEDPSALAQPVAPGRELDNLRLYAGAALVALGIVALAGRFA
jgi:membrane protease YdiL (CAAX protease family)